MVVVCSENHFCYNGELFVFTLAGPIKNRMIEDECSDDRAAFFAINAVFGAQSYLRALAGRIMLISCVLVAIVYRYDAM